ncbi:hypothetical protein CONPUDRAFT_90759 [Coniophora puteana RWD-64-598 SS2]|uniref:Uncharacterized protein n=1 Tax=Coniophora puteana (strain RWD-64-598) TaxID=741705 RepID=A0A5M3MN67_CONPW|nr:uncharacterized protein CONPUDRAFT_90759 [Coniophora puteana RWD-64-598 SS2]EIW80622.1 hypothetical protein CONPUDRAFT_90759 [Coniophora puteana RWD-64-598 SS2]
MNFIHTAIISAVLLVTQGAFAQYNPIGQPCDSPGAEGCNADAGTNNGNAYIYECGPANKFVYSAGCSCPTCCKATTSGAFCT